MVQLLTERVVQFISNHETETHTGAEREILAIEAGLDKDEINELFTYFDNIH